MKLKKGKSSYHIKGVGVMISAWLEIPKKQFMHAVHFVSIQEMMHMREKGDISGIVCCASFIDDIGEEKQRIEVFPKPDRACNLRLRYYPSMVEA